MQEYDNHKLADDELMHYGKLGMKWYQHIYQNKDGTLNSRGKKKVAKMEKKYSDVTGKKIGEKSEHKTKSVSEMSNKELQDRINRINLENQYKNLSQQSIASGKKQASSIKDMATSVVLERGKRVAGDYLEKKLREKLKLSDKSESQILADKAKDYINRQTIDKAQQYFKEGKYAEKKEAEPEHLKGKVVGNDNDKKSHNTKRKTYDDPIDTHWTDEDVGKTALALLEERKRR